jgi:hypothetical protein
MHCPIPQTNEVNIVLCPIGSLETQVQKSVSDYRKSSSSSTTEPAALIRVTRKATVGSFSMTSSQQICENDVGKRFNAIM